MLIQTEGLCKKFRLGNIETTAVDNINIQVEQGDFVSIMGASGCGKSTLLNILGMIDSPTSGKYFFLGEDIASYSERKRSVVRKANLGFIFQNFNLIDEMTVYQNVEMPLVYNRVPAEERKIKVMEMLEYMNMAHRKDHYPVQISGGQQQRIAVARALVNSPRVIFADEPTGNLDSQHSKEVMELLVKLNKSGTTIVMVTHSEEDANYSSRILRISDGTLKVEEKPALEFARC